LSTRTRPSATGTSPTPGRRSAWPLLGPAFVAAVAYVDPGNVATNVTAGAVIMEGLLRRRIPLLLRRLVTLIPAVAILAAGIDPTLALVISQVVLSFGIPFALVPLVRLTADRNLMAELSTRGSRPSSRGSSPVWSSRSTCCSWC